MARADADRNLLFGIIALQLEFIDRDALVAAMNSWVLRKGDPLGAILCEHGALADADRAAIDALVQRHLERHVGDAERSLAALSSIGSARRALEAIADSDVQATLSSIASDRHDDELHTRAPDLSTPLARGDRFRVVRFHAKGGLGVVSVAIDQELDRRVALKEIQDEHADEPASRARFLMEAEVTGKLEHPGIVPVYGLGHDPTGRPFYAMRFIDGESSLKDAIRRYHDGTPSDPGARALQLQELLRRFLDVCNAVAYAHARGVLHRDLKPGNVLLGPFGETLVVDWGLAKVTGRADVDASGMSSEPLRTSSSSGSHGETLGGRPLGTPAYASPEQVAGRLDDLGTTTDVYGLGATLYHLLTGRQPFEPGPDMLARVVRGEFPRPRQVKGDVPAALEAICLKAMALKSGDRYDSPRALADDVKRWLADEPVAAHREPLAERARRWMRRHRTAVTATAASSIVGLVGLAVVAVLQASHAGRLDEKNRALRAANAEIAAARDRAEARERLASQAVDRFREAVVDNTDVRNRPDLGPLRKKLLREPLEFYRKLREEIAASGDRSPAALARLAHSEFELGRLSAVIASPTDAARSFRAAIDILATLGDDPAHRAGLAEAERQLGVLRFAEGRPTAAKEGFERARAIYEEVVRARPDDPSFGVGLARTCSDLGDLDGDHGRIDEALADYDRARSILAAIHRTAPGVASYRAALANTEHNLAILQRRRGRLDESLAGYRRALDLRRGLARDFPDVAEYRAGVAMSGHNLANVLRDLGRSKEALAAYEDAVEQDRALVRDEPAVVNYRMNLATASYNLATHQSRLGRKADAVASYGQAIEALDALAREFPTTVAYRSQLGMAHSALGLVQEGRSRFDEAMASHDRAIAALEPVLRDHPDDLGVRSNLGSAWHNRGKALLLSGRVEEAVASFHKAIAHQRRAFEASPQFVQYRRFLSNHYNAQAEAFRRLGRPSEAAESFDGARRLWADDPVELYNIACFLVNCIPQAGPGGGPPTAEQEAGSRRCADLAVAVLRDSVRAGWRDGAHMAQDTDLDLIRDRPDFRRLEGTLLDRAFPARPFAR
jgi:serine/threonine-protein kinase